MSVKGGTANEQVWARSLIAEFQALTDPSGVCANVKLGGDVDGDYVPASKRIRVQPHDDEALLHELCHAADFQFALGTDDEAMWDSEAIARNFDDNRSGERWTRHETLAQYCDLGPDSLALAANTCDAPDERAEYVLNGVYPRFDRQLEATWTIVASYELETGQTEAVKFPTESPTGLYFLDEKGVGHFVNPTTGRSAKQPSGWVPPNLLIETDEQIIPDGWLRGLTWANEHAVIAFAEWGDQPTRVLLGSELLGWRVSCQNPSISFGLVEEGVYAFVVDNGLVSWGPVDFE